jgi:phosphodiesterase/alkaline phosphatase D-like protein
MRVTRMLFALISLLFLRAAVAQTSYTPKDVEPSAKKVGRVQITEGPSLELYRDNEAIIRWTSNNPGGSDEHFAVLHYGTDPKDLSLTAKSHIRLNQQHSSTVFRVRATDLKPHTTYYYKVDSQDASGASDGVDSPVKSFTTD